MTYVYGKTFPHAALFKALHGQWDGHAWIFGYLSEADLKRLHELPEVKVVTTKKDDRPWRP